MPALWGGGGAAHLHQFDHAQQLDKYHDREALESVAAQLHKPAREGGREGSARGKE